MDEPTLLGVLGQYEQESYGFASGELATARAYAIERYLAQPYGDEVDGRSQVVDTGLRDTIEWVMPQVLRVFLSGDEVVKFSPTSFEDEQAAKQETEYVNHVMLEKNDAFNVFSTWFRDALMAKVGYVKAYWQTRQDVLLETYEGLPDDSLMLLSQDTSVQIVEDQPYPDPMAPPAQPQMGPNGMPMPPAPPPMLHNVKVRRIKPTGFVKTDNVPPEELRVHQSLRTMSLSDCLYIQHRVRKTISEIKQDGYDVPDYIAESESNETNDAIIIARDRFNDSDDLRDDKSHDPATRRVWLIEEFVRVDFDGDGIAELRKVCRIGRTILANEECDLVPFAAVTPIVFPHKHVGIGFDDLVNEASRTKTAIARQFLDNLYLANNGRYGVNVNTVNVDDLLVSRPGGVVRVDGDPTGGIQPITHPVIGQAALEGMQWADSWRENSTGVSAYYQGLNADALNKTASGINQIMTASQGRVEAVTRSFATGVKELALIVHALTLKHATQGEKVKLNNTWTAVDPREWVKRTDMVITVGLGTGTRESRIANLMQLAQLQAQGMQAHIVTPPNLYHTGTRITEEMGYKNVDEFWTDPSKQPPQPPPPDPLVQVEQMKQQGAKELKSMDQQDKAHEFQAKSMLDEKRMREEFAVQQANDVRQSVLDQQKMELERQKMEREFQLKQWEKEQDLKFQMWAEQYRAQHQATLAEQQMHHASTLEDKKLGHDAEKTRFTFENQAQAKQTEHQAKQEGEQKKSDPIIAHLKALHDSINSPKEIVRGPDGRAVGVRPAKRT